MKITLFAVVLFLLAVLGSGRLQAEYDNIRQIDVGPVRTLTATASGTSAVSATYRALTRTINQSVLIQGTGTSPNFRVEVLCSMDGTTFVEPEVGSDLGPFTDQLPHFLPLSTPLSPGGHQFRVVEISGANSISVTVQEASQ